MNEVKFKGVAIPHPKSLSVFTKVYLLQCNNTPNVEENGKVIEERSSEIEYFHVTEKFVNGIMPASSNKDAKIFLADSVSGDNEEIIVLPKEYKSESDINLDTIIINNKNQAFELEMELNKESAKTINNKIRDLQIEMEKLRNSNKFIDEMIAARLSV